MIAARCRHNQGQQGGSVMFWETLEVDIAELRGVQPEVPEAGACPAAGASWA